MSRKHGKEDNVDWSKRGFILDSLKAVAFLGGSDLISHAFGPLPGIVFGQEKNELDYDTKTINSAEDVALKQTWWGQQMRKFLSTIPESDIIIKGVSGGEGGYSLRTNKITATYQRPETRRYYFGKGFPVFTEGVCHEATHYVTYNNGADARTTFPTSEMQANMIFGNLSYRINEDRELDKDFWKEEILKASINDYAGSSASDVYEALEKFGIEAIIENHFDDIFDIYCHELKKGREFHEAHRKISEKLGRFSERFDKNRRFYPKLREAAENSRRWFFENNLYLEKTKEGIQVMLINRRKSYREMAEIVKNYI